MSQAVTAHGGSEAASLRVAEQVRMSFWSVLPNKRSCAYLSRCCWLGNFSNAAIHGQITVF